MTFKYFAECIVIAALQSAAIRTVSRFSEDWLIVHGNTIIDIVNL